MFGEIGSFSSTVALILSFAAWVLYFQSVSRKYWIAQQISVFILLIVSFLSLIGAFVSSDFSLLLVVNNSSEIKPLIYRISAAWGNHEGSLLMWTCALSFFGLLMSCLRVADFRLQALALSFQSTLVMAFTCFMMAKSNPFARIYPPPVRGLGLNPILQDIGLAFHPPVLYLGYVGLSVAFSYAIAYAISRAEFKAVGRLMRPFVELSMGFLTLGITLGSWWAYRELGWGGYWFWDPVENASFLSWLAGCALLHSIALNSNDSLSNKIGYWLAASGFLLSVTGTFLVRSGIITSVHSFAVDPERGVFIFMLLLALFAVAVVADFYNKRSFSEFKFKLLSKPTFVLLNNLVMIFFILVILIGTFYPLLLEYVKSYKVTVGPPYYVAFFKWCVATLLVGCLIYTLCKYKIRSFMLILPTILLGVVGLIIIAMMAVFEGIHFTNTAILLLAGALFISSLHRISINGVQGLLKPHLLGHLGFAILALAIALNTSYQRDTEDVIRAKGEVMVSGFTAKLDKLDVLMGPNYVSRQGIFELTKSDSWIGRAYPEISYYPIEMQQTSESGILKTIFYDLYLTISPSDDPEEIIVRFGFRPMMNFIWLGGFLIAIAFFLAGLQNARRIT